MSHSTSIRFGLALGALLLSPLAVTADTPAERLATALRLKTVSHQDPKDFDPQPFLDLHAHLARWFPRVHAQLAHEVVADYSLLFTWPGSDPALQPMLLTSHLDVVPVADDALADWTHPPFAGVIEGGFVWGRGSLDDKQGVMATLEAVEQLLADGFAPQRTVYLAFGHDEEIGGGGGAKRITELLASRGVRFWFSLDEGMAITSGIAGLARPAALIGVAEKGFLTLDLTAKAAGGHSSVPPPSGAIGRIARAVVRLEENPLPPRMGAVAGLMFDALAPELPPLRRFALTQRWLFGPLIERMLAGEPATNAMMRTTTAVTIVGGGVKANVLPRTATVTVNFRLIPGDTAEAVTAMVREIVDDPEIEIAVRTAEEASPISRSDSEAYQALAATLAETAPDAVVAPALVLGGTDSSHYGKISDDAYRFAPMRLGPSDLARVHGVDERLSVENYGEMIRFYAALVKNAAGKK